MQTRLANRIPHDARILADHVEQDEGGSRWPSIAALPVTQRRDGESEPSGELPLRDPQSPAKRTDIQCNAARLWEVAGPYCVIFIRLIQGISSRGE